MHQAAAHLPRGQGQGLLPAAPHPQHGSGDGQQGQRRQAQEVGADATQVRQRVQAIADAAPDYEHQHGLEDDLYVDVLTMISQQSTDAGARALAKAALAARKIDFERHAA